MNSMILKISVVVKKLKWKTKARYFSFGTVYLLTNRLNCS